MSRRRPDLAERNRQRATHRMTKSKTWRAWSSMKERCLNESHPYYHRYGGRGITIDPGWMSFEQFLSDMGQAPEGLTLERVDNNRGYSRQNCRWATFRDQNNNRANNVNVTFMNRTMTVAQWSREVGLERKTLQYRIRAGWNPERALTTPSMCPRKVG